MIGANTPRRAWGASPRSPDAFGPMDVGSQDAHADQHGHARHVLPRAFTLVEMLVAIAVFSIAMGIVVDLFLVASRQQSRTSAASRVQADARLVIETIARELRDGELFTDPVVSPAISIRRDRDVVHLRRSTTGCPSNAESCVEIGRSDASGAVQFASLTSAGVDVDAFDVVFSRAAQDAVTVHIVLSTAGGRSGERTTTEAQTTIVSRVYVQ